MYYILKYNQVFLLYLVTDMMEHSSISCGRTFLYILKHCRVPDLSPKQAILSQPTQVYLKRSLMLMLIFLTNSLAISTLNQVSTSCRVEFLFTLSIFQELFHPSTMKRLPTGLNFLLCVEIPSTFFNPQTTFNFLQG